MCTGNQQGYSLGVCRAANTSHTGTMHLINKTRCCGVNVYNLVMKWDVAHERAFWDPEHVTFIIADSYEYVTGRYYSSYDISLYISKYCVT